MKRILSLFVCLLFLGSFAMYGQDIQITGTVTSADDGSPVPGAYVKIKGTNTGTTTDINGTYSVSVKPETILVFSSVGMATKEVAVGPATVVDVVLEADVIGLDEVVVTGYSTTRKASFTGAASIVKDEKITDKTDANPIKALDGIVPGMQMNVASGQPGSPATIFIRGRNSVNSGTQPLYVIDGVPLTSSSMGMRSDEGVTVTPLSDLNPADIESITVLKDATATSIYGARAANGVIVITTKKGKTGKMKVNFSAKVGSATMPKPFNGYEPVNQNQYDELYAESFLNEYAVNGEDGATAYYSEGDFEYTRQGMTDFLYAMTGADPDNKPNTNWLDEVTQTGALREYNIDIQGGGANENSVKYFASFGYLYNEGIVLGKDLTRYSGRLNLDHAPNKIVKYGFNLGLSASDINNGTGGGYFADPITLAYMLSPQFPVKYEDGSWYMDPNYGNPVAIRSKYGNKNNAKQKRLLFSPYVTLNLLDGLSFTSRGGVDYYNLKEFGYWSFLSSDGLSVNGLGEQGYTEQSVLNWSNQLNYTKSFDKHNIGIMVGQEIQKSKADDSYLSSTNYPVETLTSISLAATVGSASTSARELALASYFVDLQYNFDDKYYLSGSVRRDGSSRFNEDNRWGTFYSVGARYRISEEEFMSSFGWLNNLTVRSSYGTSGNQEVGDADVEDGWYAAQGLYGFGYNYNSQPGMVQVQLANRNLQWELTKKFNLGFDIGVFNRVNVEFDYYRHLTDDMVFGVPLSLTTGMSQSYQNIGQLENKGIEFTVNALIINNQKLKWDVSFVGSHNKNTIKKLSTDAPIEGTYTIVEVGRDYYSFKMREFAGVDPETGAPMWYKNATGDETTTVYSQAKKRYMGAATPKFTGSFSTNLQYAGFELNMQFNYSLGGQIYGNNLRYDEQVGSGAFDNFTKHVYDNRWQQPGDQTDVPGIMFLGYTGYGSAHSGYLMKADYLKLKTATLAYNIPEKILSKAKISSCRVYVTGENLFTKVADNYRGFDPSGIAATGVQWWNYPMPRNILFGVNIGL